MEEKPKLSPMMAQWAECKKQAKDAILLFQMGDFYEAFHEDAIVVARELGITLTKRQDIAMSGVPLHTCESYTDKLVAKGYQVAIAEQIGDPKASKGLVQRKVVRVISSGVLLNSSLLSDKTNNFFACLSQVGSLFGLAILDVTTAEFRVAEFENTGTLLSELYRLQPKEFLLSKKCQEKNKEFLQELKETTHAPIHTQDNWHFAEQTACNKLLNHFAVHNLDGFGLRGMTAGIQSAGALLSYLQDYRCLSLSHVQTVTQYTTSHYMLLDRTTQKNLEITESQSGGKQHTLLEVIDRTHTPMGGRLLRQLVKQPLLNPEAICQRQDAIEGFLISPKQQEETALLLQEVRDLERLMMKIASGYANPRDLVALRFSLQPLPQLKQVLDSLPPIAKLVHEQQKLIDPLEGLVALIAAALVDSPPVKVGEGKLFVKGFHQELDELISICSDSKEWVAHYQQKLREETGIKTIKVGYTRAFGYYIEVSKGQAPRMPSYLQRRQTLTNAERFISTELKEFEAKVLGAEEKITQIENQLFTKLRSDVASFSQKVLQNAKHIALIDCLCSLSIAACEQNYVRPLIDSSQTLEIKGGRHPVIEKVNMGEPFISNDTSLDKQNRAMIITGPNMAGKSTYIRQVALLTILAQIGSFLPVTSAHIGVVDKVFTRIGASDDLARGQSTFMVEMTETAAILHNVTERSLVILDEVGRGTSTYDGISIAWSIAEFLLTTPGKVGKTLFATHYWELTQLEELLPGATNYNVAVQEQGDRILFLRKIVRGGADKSYGIHVARLAGLPLSVIHRAQEILQQLEKQPSRKANSRPSPTKVNDKKTKQLTLF